MKGLKMIRLKRDIRYVQSCFNCPCCSEMVYIHTSTPSTVCKCGLGTLLPEGVPKHRLGMPEGCRLESVNEPSPKPRPTGDIMVGS